MYAEMPNFKALGAPNSDVESVVKHRIDWVLEKIIRRIPQKLIKHLVFRVAIWTDLQVVSDISLIEPWHCFYLHLRRNQELGNRFEIAIWEAYFNMDGFRCVFSVEHSTVFVE